MNRLVSLLISIAVVSSLVSSGTLASVKAATAAASATSTNTKTPISYGELSKERLLGLPKYPNEYKNSNLGY